MDPNGGGGGTEDLRFFKIFQSRLKYIQSQLVWVEIEELKIMNQEVRVEIV